MKKIIIVVLILLVVAGGGAGGLVMLGIVRNPFLHKAPDPAAQAAAAEAAANAYKGPVDQLQLVKMQDMTIPVIINGEVTRRVVVSLRLVVAQATDKGPVGDALPKFENALLQDLLAYFQTYYDRGETILDVEAVRQKARSHAEKVYGDAVKDVLLVNVFESGAAFGGRGTFAPAQ